MVTMPPARNHRVALNLTPLYALALLAQFVGSPIASADYQGLWKQWPGPDISVGPSFTVDASRHRLILLGGWTALGSNRVVWYRDLAPDSGWQGVPMPAGSPRAIRNAGIVCDAARDRALIVAGDSATTSGEVWAVALSTLDDWNRLTTTGGGPSPGPVQVFLDPALDRLVCVAGNGLWVLDLAGGLSWTAVPAGVRPPDHYGSGYALDVLRHRLLAHGGSTANWTRFSGSLHNDLWQIAVTGVDTAQWRQVRASTGYYRAAHLSYYDAARDRFLGHAGVQGWLLNATDSWSLDLAAPNASHPIASGSPNGAVAFDPVGDGLFVQAGTALFRAPLTGGAWALRDTATYPDPNHYHPQAVLDVRRHRLMLFGGGSKYQVSNDVWVLPLDSLPRWRKLAVAGQRPAARTGSAVVYDVLHDRLLVYAGYMDGMDFTDTWALSLGAVPAWTQLGTSSSFVAEDAAATFDPARNRMIVWTLAPPLSPGRLIENRFGDAIGWRVLAATGVPPTSATLQGSAFDPGRERWLLFGTGDLSNGGSEAGIWALDFATSHWSLVGDLNPGYGWNHVGGTFDPVGDRLVVFGGRRWTGPVNAVDPNDVRVFGFGPAGGLQTLATLGLPPRPRWFPWAAYDSRRDALVLAGGGSLTEPFTPEYDVWTLGWGRRHVELEEAAVESSRIRLRWSAPAFAGQGLQLWRRTSVTGWSLRSLVAVDGAGATGFDDAMVTAGERYGYRLVDPAATGVQPLDQVWVEATVNGTGTGGGEAPGALLRVDGNPAQGRLRFTIHLVQAAPVRCVLLDVQGRAWRTWDFGLLAVGDHPVDDAGVEGLGSAVMFLHVTAGPVSATRRVVILR